MKYYLTILLLIVMCSSSVVYTLYGTSVSLNLLILSSIIGCIVWLLNEVKDYQSNLNYYNTLCGNTPQMRRLRRLVRIRQAWNNFVEFNEEMAKGAGQAIRG